MPHWCPGIRVGCPGSGRRPRRSASMRFRTCGGACGCSLGSCGASGRRSSARRRVGAAAPVEAQMGKSCGLLATWRCRESKAAGGWLPCFPRLLRLGMERKQGRLAPGRSAAGGARGSDWGRCARSASWRRSSPSWRVRARPSLGRLKRDATSTVPYQHYGAMSRLQGGQKTLRWKGPQL